MRQKTKIMYSMLGTTIKKSVALDTTQWQNKSKATEQTVKEVLYKVSVTSDKQTVYNSINEGKSVVAWITDNGVYTIVEEANDSYGKRWGKLESGLGWIHLGEVVEL